MSGAAIRQVVTGRAGDDDMLQLQGNDRCCDSSRLIRVKRGGVVGGYVAEAAGPGTLLSHDQEGRLFLAEAFGDVGAGCFAADGVEPERSEQSIHFGVICRRDFFLKPVGFTADLHELHLLQLLILKVLYSDMPGALSESSTITPAGKRNVHADELHRQGDCSWTVIFTPARFMSPRHGWLR